LYYFSDMAQSRTEGQLVLFLQLPPVVQKLHISTFINPLMHNMGQNRPD